MLKSWIVIKQTDGRCRRELSVRVHCHVNGVFFGAEETIGNSMLWSLRTHRDIHGEESYKDVINEFMQGIITRLSKRLDECVKEHLEEFPHPDEGTDQGYEYE